VPSTHRDVRCDLDVSTATARVCTRTLQFSILDLIARLCHIITHTQTYSMIHQARSTPFFILQLIMRRIFRIFKYTRESRSEYADIFLESKECPVSMDAYVIFFFRMTPSFFNYKLFGKRTVFSGLSMCSTAVAQCFFWSHRGIILSAV